MHLDQDDNLDDIAAAISQSRQNVAAARTAEPGEAPPDPLTHALGFLLDRLDQLNEEQLRVSYEHLVGEIAARGLDEEIMGEEPDPSTISLDEEMNAMIQLVKRMRNNLHKQAALGKNVSNREIRETLSACVTAMKSLVSHQKSVRTLERQRVLENTLVEVLGELGDDVQQRFQLRLRDRLEELSE